MILRFSISKLFRNRSYIAGTKNVLASVIKHLYKETLFMFQEYVLLPCSDTHTHSFSFPFFRFFENLWVGGHRPPWFATDFHIIYFLSVDFHKVLFIIIYYSWIFTHHILVSINETVINEGPMMEVLTA